jgi:hypothetical protein
MTKNLVIHVEGPTDAAWVTELLRSAFDFNVIPRGLVIAYDRGIQEIIQKVAAAAERPEYSDIHIALLDADAPTVAEARARARLGAETLVDRIFFAIPSIEAWLLADPFAALRNSLSTSADLIQRLGPPDEMAFPREVLKHLFECDKWGRPRAAEKIIRDTDYRIAATRSPSLRAFLTGVGELIGEKKYEGIPDGYAAFGPRVFASLIGEFSPQDKIVYRTLNGKQLTAAQLMREINEGSSLGQHYVSDLLRIARNILARDATSTGD